ncbi:hypothetical protein HS088_TW19G00588 [Tripterygium wilfordii]|uniref:Translocon-associated protein subunit beta n=1 Tax=Tripterygium wilfordii TaxID=458696 RepID=A0A7J7CAN4_TRIWF|nr:translocon-associated protein subunit beta-like [Tripterygium wilfordii]KAF5730985.1 hypothetical protein HS088_TW19G00588 [Tripterygium wilfordii]
MKTSTGVIAVVAILLFISSALAVSETPFILAHKKVSLTGLKSGSERVSVSIDIYNRGFVDAYDVSVSDSSWASHVFDYVSGNTSNSWERLDAGSVVSHSFELESKVKGMFYGAHAVITFRIATKTALQEAYSTPILPLDILADRVPDKKFALRLLTKYGSQLSVITIVVLFAHLIATPSKSKATKGRKRQH